MKLSIIIVNYNVKYFLEQCLHSVRKAIKSVDSEVFVVDNNSVDGSCAMVASKFPEVQLIENKVNTGFSVANNQAINFAKGEYVLLLNPDTLVEEDTFAKVVDFMDNTPDAGGLGVKMIDGNGNFLPESKRGLPTPWVAFYKVFGLSKIFPKSKRFGKYHLGFLDKEQVHEIEVLSGAFMLLRKSVLDKIGLLDETFFMYGEDIDLSYRIILAGFKNYYFPKTTIIHYKGESTKKGSINYVVVFYKAMVIFAKKHFSQKNASIFSFLINLAIYFRAGLAIVKRFVLASLLPLLDALFIYLGYKLITPYWENSVFSGRRYPPEFWSFTIPTYIFIWLLTLFFTGAYEKPVKISKIIRGLTFGTLIIITFYSLLNENYRFSRALILIGALWAFATLLGYRSLLHFGKILGFHFDFNRKKRIAIVGHLSESQRVYSVLKQANINHELIGFVSPSSKGKSGEFIGKINQLHEIIKINKIDELIFCAKDLSSQIIIQWMLQLSDFNIDFKIAPPESISIIGSNSIDAPGELYVIHINSIAKPDNIRNKRLLDILLSVSFIALSVFLIWFQKQKNNFIQNCFAVLYGNKSWVGYCQQVDNKNINLPRIKTGVLNPLDIQDNKNVDNETIERLNMIYAKDYKIYNDLYIIALRFINLGK